MAKQASGQLMTGKDLFVLPDGSVYHVGVKKGDFAARILTVGDFARAEEAKKLLDHGSVTYDKVSSRLYKVITGKFKGVPVSIVGIGMGSCMVDFMVKELSALESGPLACIRVGTCGILDETVRPGTITVADEAALLFTDYRISSADRKKAQPKDCPLLSPFEPSHKPLTDLLCAKLKANDTPYISGLHASSENFFYCQGRTCQDFIEDSGNVISRLKAKNVKSLEMETHQLFYLANVRRQPLYAAACHLGIVNRCNDDFENVSTEEKEEQVKSALLCSLQALVEFQF